MYASLVAVVVVGGQQPPLLEQEEEASENSSRCCRVRERHSAGRDKEHTTPAYVGARGTWSKQRATRIIGFMKK